ncbi:hypothetical protein ACQ4PT_039405 [Festuca glaucescens]
MVPVEKVDSDDIVLSGDEEDEEYKEVLKQLNDGTHEVYRHGEYRCPFDVTILDMTYMSLLQHADGRSKSGKWLPRHRAHHKALIEYLRNLPWAEGAREASLKAIGVGPSKNAFYKPY